MTSDQASEVILVHAVESVDEKGEILSFEERRQANDALEGEGAGSPLEAEVARAETLVGHIKRRAPWLWGTTQQFSTFSWRFTILCALVAAFFGASFQVLDGGRTFHVLSTPLLGLLLWNTISLSFLLLGPLWLQRKHQARQSAQGKADDKSDGLPESRWGQTVLGWLLTLRRKWIDWRKPTSEDLTQKLSVRALRGYWDEWPKHASKLLQAQSTRLLHLCTMAFCVSALLVAYSRGLTKAYRATRESTFLTSGQVDVILGVVFLPSKMFLGSLPPTKAGASGLLGPAAPWIHHYALTLVLLVLLPRLVLFVWSSLQSYWLTLRLPLTMDALSKVPTLNVALSSHTNVGKTSLARTLLRRDVGEVRDAEHVTRRRAGYFLINSADARLRLWDTPGFGDARLLAQHLKEQQGWSWLRSLQDPALRYDREAALSLQDEADLILYLVPAHAGSDVERTMREEWEVLRHVGQPVICILNRLDGVTVAEEEKLIAHWKAFFAAEPLCRDVLSLDAFSRSLDDELRLFAAIEKAVSPKRRPLAQRLRQHWEAEHQQRHLAACGTVAAALHELSLDNERETGKEAGRRLQKRAQQIITRAQDSLLSNMGLKGELRDKMLAESEEFLHSVIPNRGERTLGAIIGGALSGLASGIVTDFLAGGMTFFGGAATGLVLGALGGAAVAEGYRRVGSRGARKLVWQEDFLKGVALRLALLYLSAASFGRARGEFTDDVLDGALDDSGKNKPRDDKDKASGLTEAEARRQAELFAAVEAALAIHWPYVWPLLAVEHDPKAGKLWDKLLPVSGKPAWVSHIQPDALESPAPPKGDGGDATPLEAGCTALLDEALSQWKARRQPIGNTDTQAS